LARKVRGAYQLGQFELFTRLDRYHDAQHSNPREWHFKTLHSVLNKGINTSQALKEREKMAYTTRDYQRKRAELNQTKFLQPLDADNSKASIYYTKKKLNRYTALTTWAEQADMRQILWLRGCRTLARRDPWEELRQRLHDVVPSLDMRDVHCEEAKERQEEVCQPVLARFQDALPSSEWEVCGCERFKRGCEGMRCSRCSHVGHGTLTRQVKYINSELEVKFNLDTTSKPKRVAGPDDFLLLTHHWARDESVFPTEDDRHDVATIMLSLAYTSGRPAEFVHASKGKASQDPLSEAEEGEGKPVCPTVLKYLENTHCLMINHQKLILYGLLLVGNS
jgi:hypothetical protein